METPTEMDELLIKINTAVETIVAIRQSFQASPSNKFDRPSSRSSLATTISSDRSSRSSTEMMITLDRYYLPPTFFEILVRHLRGNLVVKNKYYLLKLHKLCFKGGPAIELLVRNGIARTRPEAEKMLSVLLVRFPWITPVQASADRLTFQSDMVYRFTSKFHYQAVGQIPQLIHAHALQYESEIQKAMLTPPKKYSFAPISGSMKQLLNSSVLQIMYRAAYKVLQRQDQLVNFDGTTSCLGIELVQVLLDLRFVEHELEGIYAAQLMMHEGYLQSSFDPDGPFQNAFLFYRCLAPTK